jgi:hypothetical protein
VKPQNKLFLYGVGLFVIQGLNSWCISAYLNRLHIRKLFKDRANSVEHLAQTVWIDYPL